MVNPSYSADAKTNIGKVFFRTLKKNFPRKHLFYKVFNKNTTKLSYSCITNIAAIISSHNKQILKPKIESYGCNCRDRDSCPMENQCLTPQIVYRADVSNNKDNETKFYYGLTETSFKKRYGNHKRSFIHEQHKNDTELSKYILDLTSAHKVPTIKWCIVRKIHGNAKSDFCKLCLTEKYFILNNLGDNKLLNKKSEFVNKCRHQKKLLLSSVLCEDSMD